MSSTPAGLTVLRRPSAGDAEGALVLFHGRGADEHDLLPLLDALDPKGRLVGLTPRGPLSLPPGGAHWYAVREIGFPDPETFAATFPRVCAWIDSLPASTGVPLDRTVVGGFSQGAVLSYAVSLATGRPRPAGIIALSGFIPTVPTLSLQLEHLDGFPVAIGHGAADPVISVEWGRRARERLEEGDASVLYSESRLGHSIEPAFVRRLSVWLGDVLGPQP